MDRTLGNFKWAWIIKFPPKPNALFIFKVYFLEKAYHWGQSIGQKQAWGRVAHRGDWTTNLTSGE